jgi:uncharacterized delta-60 repeat protein
MKRIGDRNFCGSFADIFLITGNGRFDLIKCVFFILMAITIVMPRIASAKQGDLDPTFGSGGKVVTDFGSDDLGQAIAIQPDGKIVVVGKTEEYPVFHSALARYNADGTLDQTFGSGGKVVIALDASGDRLISVIILPDGKILTAGSLYQNNLDLSFLLVRFNADGSLDQTFGAGGLANVAFGDNTAEVSTILTQPDGKIVVAGTSGRGQGNDMNDFALARFNSEGGTDKSFGVGGKLKTHFSGTNSGTRAGSAVLQPDGKIVVAGSYKTDGVTREFALARYDPDGSLDASFGNGGTLATVFDKDVHGISVVLQPDGKIIVGGYLETGFFRNNDFALARYNPNGDLDLTFGSGGRVVKDLYDRTNDIIYTLLLQNDGKLIAVGRTGGGVSFTFAVVRFNANGEYDGNFGDGGKVATAFGDVPSEAFSAALQSNGRIVAAGYSHDEFTTDHNFALARYVAFSQAKQFDFDKDAEADISVYRAGTWYVSRSTGGFSILQFGLSSDKIVPGDFDGDGKTDIAVFRPSEGNWYVLNSSDGTYTILHFGLNGDIPVNGDYDGDGRADFAVYRQGVWYIQQSSGGFTGAQFGLAADRPVPADYDGDGKTDIGVFRDGVWYIYASSQGLSILQFGESGDRVVEGDYDLDGKVDEAVWRPGEGVWYIYQSTTGTVRAFVFGLPTDTPAPGDYDGDGKIDFAVYRGSGNWWIWQSGASNFISQNFGLAGDVPVPSAYVY